MHLTKNSQKSGLPPGSLIYVGDEKPRHVITSCLLSYNQSDLVEKEIENLSTYIKKGYIQWLNVDGVHDAKKVEEIGSFLNLHPLTLEDILNTKQRPKIEFYDNYIYASLKAITYSEELEKFHKEQIGIILQEGLVVTFQQRPNGTFNDVRSRLRNSRGHIRRMGADYLFYALIDSVIDGYFSVVETLDDECENIEKRLEEDVSIVADVQWLKKELLYIRRSTSPVVDIIRSLRREESPLIQEKTMIYFKDTQDHCLQIYDSVELIRDIVNGLIELELSSVSNKMNEIMKYLTVFASIFIPLTFVTGIYGMNFEYMPELKWKYGYHTLLVFLLFIGFFLLILFKRKKWL